MYYNKDKYKVKIYQKLRVKNEEKTHMYSSVPNMHLVQQPLDLFCIGNFCKKTNNTYFFVETYGEICNNLYNHYSPACL